MARAPEEPLPPIAASSHTDQLLEQAKVHHRVEAEVSDKDIELKFGEKVAG